MPLEAEAGQLALMTVKGLALDVRGHDLVLRSTNAPRDATPIVGTLETSGANVRIRAPSSEALFADATVLPIDERHWRIERQAPAGRIGDLVLVLEKLDPATPKKRLCFSADFHTVERRVACGKDETDATRAS